MLKIYILHYAYLNIHCIQFIIVLNSMSLDIIYFLFTFLISAGPRFGQNPTRYRRFISLLHLTFSFITHCIFIWTLHTYILVVILICYVIIFFNRLSQQSLDTLPKYRLHKFILPRHKRIICLDILIIFNSDTRLTIHIVICSLLIWILSGSKYFYFLFNTLENLIQ